MNNLRQRAISRIFSLLTGVVFLNMSFFLAEVCLLDIQDKQMIENVAQLILNGGLEEERDGHATTVDGGLKVFSLVSDALMLRHSSLFLIASRVHQEFIDHYTPSDHSEKFTPPPEVSIG